ncbi:uncharacterized protein LOC112904553 isoform X2 [Agrilus planipennis]|uniref:Uncharacterized protein LOC112904553 isoform X1 n=1 Tax=Agrilus planipennis TaxID=224129 RepID=A0A7F5R454_AGRPL|nr:uncharacterized protein LOC112904553 isoform X1 [Agrilus planipennis]XP_025830557.1 uncharacterized protein LOC112904553 isoform X2 [Agrilus planipennis]
MFFCVPVNNWEVESETGKSGAWDHVKIFYRKFVQTLKGVSGKTWIKLQKWILVDPTPEQNLESFSDLAFYYHHHPGKDLNTSNCFLKQNQKTMKSAGHYECYDKPFNIFTASSHFEEHHPGKVRKKVKTNGSYSGNLDKSSNSLDSFFESIADTIKKMPAVVQAHLRLQIAQLVFSQELKLLQYQSTTSFENNT